MEILSREIHCIYLWNILLLCAISYKYLSLKYMYITSLRYIEISITKIYHFFVLYGNMYLWKTSLPAIWKYLSLKYIASLSYIEIQCIYLWNILLLCDIWKISISEVYCYIRVLKTLPKYEHKISKSVTLTSRSPMVGHDGSAKNLRPISTNIQSINLIHLHVQEIDLYKTLTKNFNTRFLSMWPWPQGHPGWVLMELHKTSDQYLLTRKVSTESINIFMRYRLIKTLIKNFNTKFLSLWPWPQGHLGWVLMVLHKT